MNAASQTCSQRINLPALRLLTGLLSIALCAGSLVAQSAGCNRARAIVDEAKVLYELPQPDHRVILQKLRTAQQLCPTLGDAWHYAYCSATAIGDESNARMFKDRAIFNG